MSKYTELQILKAEEKTLVGILSKLNDQLNRLKVEEMALMSQIRSGKKEPEAEPEASTSDAIDMTGDNKPLPELELGIQRFVLRGSDQEEEEEEEEESDDDGDDNESAHDQLTAFLKHLQARS